METKRLALAIGLSAAVLLAWAILFPAPRPQPAPRVPEAVTRKVEPTVAPTPAAVAAAPAKREAIAAGEATDVVVTSDLYTARLSNRGGALLSFVLTKYPTCASQPLDLVRHDAPFPGSTLRLSSTDPTAEAAAAALWRVETERTQREARVRFRYRDAEGNGFLRTYVFRQSYVVGLSVEREGGGAASVTLGPGLGNPSPEELKGRFATPGGSVVLSASGSADHRQKDALKDVTSATGAAVAGLEDNYFLMAFLPSPRATVNLRPVVLGAGSANPKGSAETEVVLSGSPRADGEVYLGPKKLDILEAAHQGLENAVDFGMFAILVKPLLATLKAINTGVHNWGLSIVLITVLIKIVLYPLTHKQLVSMKKMSQVQPRVDEIRAKWSPRLKKDAEARLKMNQEMMDLYKKEGINPAGGCLPLLLQMPILFAFYRLLASAIELRCAPLGLWITDLSTKDPYYVLPIVMTGTMWLQQQMSPPAGDPAMRRMMSMMPLVFGFMFKDTPSGLVLYWLVQNVLTIAQQAILNRFTDLGPKSRK